MNLLIVTWQGGGATQPAIGLGRMLAERGHRVRILGPARFADRIAAAGCLHRPLPATVEFDAGKGRAMEEQQDFVDAVVLGSGMPAALADELAAEPADAAVVDCLMRTTICQAEALATPVVPLFHLMHRFHGVPHGGEEEWGWCWQYRQLNAFREQLGLEALPIGPETVAVALARRAPAAIVAMPREFDEWPDDAPPGVVHAGPIFEEGEAPPWAPPWPSDDGRPLIVVSMGTTYMHQEALLERLAEALSGLDVRALLLTGHELDPAELSPTGDVHVREFVPHSAVFGEAALVVTHAGVGTLMAAFAAGVPVLCLPLGRDQADNARRVEEIGCGSVISPQSDVGEIRAAVRACLDSKPLRGAARRMAGAVAAYDDAAAAEAVERAAGTDARR